MSGIIDCEMHIGDEVFVHGYIDEIRNDTIIISNMGGYFGTSRDEVFYYEEDELQTDNSAFVIDMALAKCKAQHNGCENCNKKCMWRDELQTQKPCDNCQEWTCDWCAYAQTEREGK